MPARTNAPPPVIVLGMHRSGTSCLAGCLQEAGLFLGEVNERAPANSKGNRESLAIMTLHEDVLAANAASWDRPRPGLGWSAEHAARRRAIIDGFPADRTWGFKDPRTLMLLDGWIEALPGVRFAGSFRHPHAVAGSLQRRNGYPPEKSFQIWAAYNRELLRYHAKFGFGLINFDLPAEAYLRQVTRIARGLDLSAEASGIGFFDSGLRRNMPQDDADLPTDLRDIHASLIERSEC